MENENIIDEKKKKDQDSKINEFNVFILTSNIIKFELLSEKKEKD